MAGKVKISADLMLLVMEGKLSGPDAMEAETMQREIAKLRRSVKRLREKASAQEDAANKAEAELAALIAP